MGSALPLEIGISGKFMLRKGRRLSDGSEIVTGEVGPFWNLIVNNGLDRFVSEESNAFDRCIVGSGSSTPANGDTWLQTYIAATTTVQSESWSTHTSPAYFIRKTMTFRFGEGVAEGNISEVGMAYGASSPSLFSRALVLDGLGDPTTITVLSGEFLDVTYVHEYYIASGDVTGAIELDGDDYDYIVRPGGLMNQWSPQFAVNSLRFLACTSNMVGHGAINTDAVAATVDTSNPSNAESVTTSTYTPGNYYRDMTVAFGLGNANLSGGIRTVIFSPMTDGCGQVGAAQKVGRVQCQFDPALPKTSDKVLSLTFRVSWARRP